MAKIDEAKEKRKLTMSEEDFLDKIKETQKNDPAFDELAVDLVFREKIQEDPESGRQEIKKMAQLPDNVIVFPDKREDLDKVKCGIPYICMIKRVVTDKEKGTEVGFARIISEQKMPTMFLSQNGVASAIWRDNKGDFRREIYGLDKEEKEGKLKPSNEQLRVLKALWILKNKADAERVQIVFRENQ